MGGRGSSGGNSGIKYASPDRTIINNGEKMLAERLTGGYGSDAIILQATSDGKGNLSLDYAKTTGYREQNKKTSYAQYEISAGLSNRTGTGKSKDLTSHNINWDNVKSVSGKTYGTQSLMRANGFTWDKARKIWVKA